MQFERNLELLVRQKFPLTATAIVSAEQPMILLFEELIHRIEVQDNRLKFYEKQEKKLEITECNYAILQGEMDRIGIDILGLEAGNSTDDMIEEIKKKDKIIDKMAEHIYKGCDFDNRIQTKEQILEYFKKEVEKEC